METQRENERIDKKIKGNFTVPTKTAPIVLREDKDQE